jgi:hypothetical protein
MSTCDPRDNKVNYALTWFMFNETYTICCNCIPRMHAIVAPTNIIISHVIIANQFTMALYNQLHHRSASCIFTSSAHCAPSFATGCTHSPTAINASGSCPSMIQNFRLVHITLQPTFQWHTTIQTPNPSSILPPTQPPQPASPPSKEEECVQAQMCHEMMAHVTQLELPVVMLGMLHANGVDVQGVWPLIGTETPK